MGERSVLIGGARTPFGKLGGGLASLTAVELGQIALRANLERAGIDGADVEDVIFGQVLQGGAGQNPARQVALGIGLDRTVNAETINRVCGSGMRAITLADTMIRAGDYRVIAAGGMESMSNAPYIVRKARFGYRMGDGVFEDMMIGDGLMCAIEGCHMGIHGGKVAAEDWAMIRASGTRIVLTLVQELEERGGGIGVAAICSGGGQGDALLLEV
jgi:acetyl-CoA C-acetyltransferase